MTNHGELAARLANDLDKTFPDFVRLFESNVFSIALRMSGNREDALDLSADTFHRAYSALRRYDKARIKKLELRAWTVTIVLNCCRNAARSNSRRPTEVTLEAVTSRATSDNNTPEGVTERNETVRELSRALLRLPIGERESVVLRHVVGLSFEEIARVLRCPIGTAKSHASRGLRHLERFVLSSAKEIR